MRLGRLTAGFFFRGVFLDEGIWVGRRGRRKRRREGVDEKGEGEGDEKREKGKLTRSVLEGFKSAIGEGFCLRDMF